MSVGERLVRPDGKRERRIPSCKPEKVKRAKGGDHNGREGNAQVVPVMERGFRLVITK